MSKTKKTDEKVKTVKKATGKGEKFADMSEGAPIIDESSLTKALKETEVVNKKSPKVRGKKYQTAKAKVEPRAYSPQEAFDLLKKVSFGQFHGTVEAHLNVTEKGLSGEVTLPHFAGKARKVVIFDNQIAEELKEGKINFDVLLASATDMPKILPFAKLLGPRGLMPNPKNGTLVPDPAKALTNFASNSLHFKTEKDFPLIHVAIGKVNQPVEELVENLEALIKAINPKNIKKVVVKSTMSPGIKVSL